MTVAPWTIRNAYELHAFVPTTTQLGWALAGTYNDQARTDPDNPASWRSLFRVPELRAIDRRHPGEPEAERERRWRAVALDYIREHPTYVATVAYWNTRRLLDLVSRDWSRHTASTVSVTPGWSDIGVVCFWVFAVLALFARRVREAPAYVWAVPLLMYVSVVLLASETPRYRAALDPFVILLAALALQRLQEPPDALREPLRRFGGERQPHERAGRLGGEERAAGRDDHAGGAARAAPARGRRCPPAAAPRGSSRPRAAAAAAAPRARRRARRGARAACAAAA